jgi:hypothetical protein
MTAIEIPFDDIELDDPPPVSEPPQAQEQPSHPRASRRPAVASSLPRGGPTIDLGSLRNLTIEDWERLCRHLLPGGKKEGCRWLAGSISGEPGRSLDVNLRTGQWCDWAGDFKGCGALDLWMTTRGVDFKTAVRELSVWLGRPTDISPARPTRFHSTAEENEKKIFFPRDLSRPTNRDLQILFQSRSIGIEALQVAVERGFLLCFDDELNGRSWLYTDQRRRCGLRRRLDNQPFRLRSGSAPKSAACPGSDMRSPIGYQEAAPYPYIGIAEGGPNALAIIAHAWASGLEKHIAPVCMPSTTSNFTASALAHLQGKRGRIFIDDDAPGHAAAERWAAQLASADIVVDGFSFTGLVMSDGRPVTDLNELLKIDYDCWEEHREQVESIMNFSL